ncbi:hypothetical protein CF326_g1495 [Tilletia indica]|nr:hypothetical protein CF326_g1495 [Tilletia indica]
MIGYIDDGLMYTTSLDAHQNCRTLEYAYETAERWILGVGLSFDQQKRELIHFYPPYLRKPKRPEIQPAVTLNGVDVAALRDGDTVRWLGFHLDNKLSFQGHVRIMCAKARKAAQCMRMLVNTVRGLRAHDARRLYVGCVLPIMTYGTAVWWRSRTREEPSRSPTGIAQRVNHRGTVTMLDKLGREQSYALRMVLPVWRTTSTNALLIESGCMPIEFYLDRILDRSAIRLSTLPLNHTLLRRAGAFDIADGESPALRNKAQRPPFKLDTSAEAARRKRRFSTRLTILARRCPPTIEREQWLRPPWWTPIGALHQVEIVPRSAFPEDKKEAGLQVCEEVWRRWEEVRVFTDGSRMEDGNTGVGWVIYRGDREVRVAAVSTGPRMEVFDAEVLGLLWGFDTAFRYAREQDVKTITVYCDNTAAIQAISSGQGTSSLPHIKSLDKRIRSWLRGDQGNRLRISWVPGHVGVTGNERADDLAKVGATRGGAMVHPTTSISYAKRVVNERATKAWQSAWETALTGRSSWYQSTLLQIRTGHGDFADYHERFGHETATLTCVCGDPRAPLHPLECPVFAVHRPLLQDEDGRSLTHEQLLNDKKGIRALLAFARASRAYERDTYMHEDEVHG